MVNVALPTMAEDFKIDIAIVQWVAMAFFIGVSSLHLPAGRLGDLFGRKQVYLGGYIVTTIGFIGAVFSPTVYWLIAFRALQGMGASAIQANATAIMVSSYPPERRGRAIGFFGTMSALGLAFGPIIGGAVLEVGDWPLLFSILIPWCILGFLMGIISIPSTHVKAPGHFDSIGTVLLVMTLGPIVFALNRGFADGWTSTLTISFLAIFMMFGVLFVRRQKSAASPLVDPSIFASSMFTSGVLIAFLGFAGFSSVMLLMPFLIQNLMGLPVAQVGLLVSISWFVTAAFSFVSGPFVDRFGTRPVLSFGSIMLVVCYIIISTFDSSSAILQVILVMALLGFAQAFWMIPTNTRILGSVSRHQLGLAGGFVAFARTFGLAIGQALWGGIFSFIVLSGNDSTIALEAPRKFQEAGFNTSFLIGAALAAVVALLAVTTRSNIVKQPDN
jgi:EmrB/QacA subfamily drug resistance transporter